MRIPLINVFLVKITSIYTFLLASRVGQEMRDNTKIFRVFTVNFRINSTEMANFS